MTKTILLVDDDMIQLEMFKRLLTANGYHCQTALSVDEAQQLLKNKLPDLIISDYQMPVKKRLRFSADVTGKR